MDKYVVYITDDAYDDLACIAKYIIEKYNDKYSAERILNRLFNKCQSLSVFPIRSSMRYLVNDRTVRSVHSGDYTVLYYVDKENGVIRIVAITNSRRNISALLDKRNG